MTYKTLARVALVVAGFVAAPVFLRADIIEQILVKINGDIFTKSDLENRQVAMLRQRGEQVDLRDANNQQLRRALDEITPRLMVDAVDELLVVQRGRELGYRLSDEQFKTVLDNIKKENKLETDEQFEAALKGENITMADLRKNLERQMIMQRVQQNEVVGKVGVSEEEARAYYQAHLSEFTTPPSVSLREILVTVPGSAQGLNVAEDEAGKAKADGIRARALAGESFEKLVAETSDSPSKANGGLIGPISLNDLSPDLRTIIEAMKAGDITDVFRTPRGYQLMKLESATAMQTLPFDVARNEISDRVVTGKRQEEFLKYLAKLRSQAIIEWKNADVEKAYNEGLKQIAALAAQAPASR